ncbi:MAG: COX15/CtaA family protein [Xanthomonadales bacterium]|nr:COX15/CtaA family protein [Xanthomonadales bacterium]
MNLLAKICLVLVIVLVSLSAYLRLAHSGIGCADWPACYGHIGDAPSVSQPFTSEDAYQTLVTESNEPLAWATPLHRLVASVLGLLVVFLAFLSIRRKRQRVASFALLALTVYLAVLGIRSGSLHDPAVVMGNLAGGFCMLGLVGWMVFSDGGRRGGSPRVRRLTAAAIAVLSVQVLLGGLTSANFAATSCQTLPDCHGSWWPGSSLMKAMDLSRTHEVTSSGQAIGGEERLAIHKAHRLGSVVTVILVLFAALAALLESSRFRAIAIVLLILAASEFTIGVSAILSSIPIGLAVAHNWFAGLLLLALLKLLALARST